jgi:hypothetical protein
VLSAGILSDIAATQAMTGCLAESDRRFAQAISSIDAIGTADLGEIRRQIVDAWGSALIHHSRHAEATALRSGSLPQIGAQEQARHDHHAHDHAKGGCSCCH